MRKNNEIMGSATIVHNNTTNMDDKKKSIKGMIKNIFGKKKVCEKSFKKNGKEFKVETEKEVKQQPQSAVDAILANLKKLEIESSKNCEDDELKNFSYKPVTEDTQNELDNFTFKPVEEERRTERTDSHSSEDSGFSENNDLETQKRNCNKDETFKTDEVSIKIEKDDVDTEVSKKDDVEDKVLEALDNLKIEDDKKKKTQVLHISRTPIRNRVQQFVPGAHPYNYDTAESFRQINQINKHTFSGGHVMVCKQDFVPSTVNTEVAHKDTNEELQNFDNGLEMRGVQLNGQPFELDLIQEYLDEKREPDFLEDFIKDPNNQEHIQTITAIVGSHIETENPVEQVEAAQRSFEFDNPIEQLENTSHVNYEQIANLDTLIGYEEDKLYSNMFPTPPSAETAYSPRNDQFYTFLTPPRSEIASSPYSDSTMYPTNSDYTLSPNSDCEKYQDIPQYNEEHPTLKEEDLTEKKDIERERNTSTSSMSMKNFKDLQRELAGKYSKKECCQINRQPWKQVLQEHMNKFTAEERRNLCMKVASMDLKAAYGVLHQILLSVCRGTNDEDLHFALFALICERVLGEQPQLFAGDFGLGILKAAVLRCPQQPRLARCVVRCTRAAVRANPALMEGRECLFKEVDAAGDTLVTACARAGDALADALAEIVRTEHNDISLFNVQHANTEGYSALAVACRQHSLSCPSAHTVHVLLEHGHADIWKGDVKGGDTAVHMAVNSPTCDLNLILLLFKHLDRKMWKKLAHVPNRSSVTPLDYARCAAKSSTRQNYPSEVLEFLKKCR